MNKNQRCWLPARWEYAEYLVSPMYRARGYRDWKETIRIWERRREEAGTLEIVGVVGSENPDRNAYLQVHPYCRFIEEEMIQWAEGNISVAAPDGDSRRIAVWAHDDDDFRQTILLKRGYAKTGECDFQTRMYLDGDIPAAEIPEGCSIRSACLNVDLDKRGEAVARAFNPSIDKVGIAQQIQAYLIMRTAPSYRADLDLVALLQDGQVGAVCTIWFDAANLTGYVEPVATNPEHQRRGLGRAVVLEGLRRLRHLGGGVAYVNPYGEWRSSFYQAIGFVPYAVYRRWEKDFRG